MHGCDVSINVIQPSFGSGELSPTLFARVDLQKYRVGAAALRNFFVEYRGGASNRPGTEVVGRCKQAFGTPPRLIPFTFSVTQTYMLEFGQLYIRIIQNGGYVLETAVPITGITQASPGVVTAVAHGYSTGDQLYISSVGGMTQINSTVGKQYLAVVINANTFSLTDLDGTAINTTAYTAYTSGGNVQRVFTITTTYQAADLPLLKYTQSADTMTLTHPTYAPATLTRTGATTWPLTAITFAALVQKPTSPGAANTGGGTGLDYYYVITALTDNPAEESVPSDVASVSDKGALDQTTGKNNTITYVAPVTGPAPTRYNIYKANPIAHSLTQPTRFGLIGQSTNLTFIDTNIAPDFTQAPPSHTNPFTSDNNPGCVTYFEQRLTYAGSTDNPETFWMSKPGSFNNMDVSEPVQESDAITGTLASNDVNAIESLVSVQSGLIALTQNGAWLINGGTSGAGVTPGNIIAKAQAFVGASPIVPPLRINEHILFVQNKGALVRDFVYNFVQNVFTGTDMSVLSNHLFEGRTIREWAYSEEPHKIIWAVRDDGIMLSFTYLKEQDVYAWARHDTQGLFQSVASVQETQDTSIAGASGQSTDAVYFIVARRINGSWHYYTERQASRSLGQNIPLGIPADSALAWFVDCGLQTTLTFPNAMLTVSDYGPTGTTGITCTASAAVFAGTSADTGKVIRCGGGILTVTAPISTTQLTVTATRQIAALIPNIPEDLDPVPVPFAADSWSFTSAGTSITGLDHLNGMEVAILANGNVQANQTVASGAITLSQAADLVTVGLPFVSQLQTLRLDTGDPTIQGKRKKISSVNNIINESRGWSMGRTLDTLVESREGPPPGYGLPIGLVSNIVNFNIDPLWDVDGQYWIEQSFPLPLSLLGVVPEITVGDNAGMMKAGAK